MRSRVVSRTCHLVLALCGTNTVFAEDAGSAVSEGRELYVSQQCWQCHGYEGQGGAAVRIAPTLYPFEVFADRVRRTNLMPAYSRKVLSDDALRKIYDFVRSIPEPPAIEDIPELNTAATGLSPTVATAAAARRWAQ